MIGYPAFLFSIGDLCIVFQLATKAPILKKMFILEKIDGVLSATWDPTVHLSRSVE